MPLPGTLTACSLFAPVSIASSAPESRSFSAGVYLLKVNNTNTRTMCEIRSKLIIKTLPEQRFIQISHDVLVFLLFTLSKYVPTGLGHFMFPIAAKATFKAFKEGKFDSDTLKTFVGLPGVHLYGYYYTYWNHHPVIPNNELKLIKVGWDYIYFYSITRINSTAFAPPHYLTS